MTGKVVDLREARMWRSIRSRIRQDLADLEAERAARSEQPAVDLRAAYADPALGVVMQSHQDAVQITLGAPDGEIELWLEPDVAERFADEIRRCAEDARRPR